METVKKLENNLRDFSSKKRVKCSKDELANTLKDQKDVNESVNFNKWITFPDYPECKWFKIGWFFHYVDSATANQIIGALNRKKLQNPHDVTLSKEELMEIEKKWLERLKNKHPKLLPWKWWVKKYLRQLIFDFYDETENTTIPEKTKEEIVANKVNINTDRNGMLDSMYKLTIQHFSSSINSYWKNEFLLWDNNKKYIKIWKILYLVNQHSARIIADYIKYKKQNRLNPNISVEELKIIQNLSKIIKSKESTEKH